MTAADWLKFLPGWFAAVAAVWTLIDKRQTRRHRLALGPDSDELREQLKRVRHLFDQIVEEGRPKDWFAADDRGDVYQTLMDLSRRRDDWLGNVLLTAALAWEAARSSAPPPGAPISKIESITQEQWLDTDAALVVASWDLRMQREEAEEGRTWVHVALTHLNNLERRAHSRS